MSEADIDFRLTKDIDSKASGLVSLAGSHTLFITNTVSIAEHNYIKKRYE